MRRKTCELGATTDEVPNVQKVSWKVLLTSACAQQEGHRVGTTSRNQYSSRKLWPSCSLQAKEARCHTRESGLSGQQALELARFRCVCVVCPCTAVATSKSFRLIDQDKCNARPLTIRCGCLNPTEADDCIVDESDTSRPRSKRPRRCQAHTPYCFWVMGAAPLEVYFTSLAESPSFQGTRSLHDELGTGLLHYCGASVLLVILLGLLTCRLHPRKHFQGWPIRVAHSSISTSTTNRTCNV